MLQYKLGDAVISVNRIKKLLNSCECVLINEGAVWLNSAIGSYDYKNIIDEEENSFKSLSLDYEQDMIRNDYLKIMNAFTIDLDKLVIYRNDFNKELKKIKYKIKKA